MTTPESDIRTVVPTGIKDPVVAAQVELKAALAALEDKLNFPRRLQRGVARARVSAARKPVAALVIVGTIAAGVGIAVWGAVQSSQR